MLYLGSVLDRVQVEVGHQTFSGPTLNHVLGTYFRKPLRLLYGPRGYSLSYYSGKATATLHESAYILTPWSLIGRATDQFT